MSEPATEQEFRDILAEMNASDAWARLDRQSQVAWLRWIANSGELPRTRMYQAANRLNEGKVRPPRLSRARGVAGALLEALAPWS